MMIIAPERVRYFEEVYERYGTHPKIKHLRTKADYLAFKRWCKKEGKLPKVYPLPEVKSPTPLIGCVPTAEQLIDAVKIQALNQIKASTPDAAKWAKIALVICKLEIPAYKNVGKEANNFTPDDYLKLFNEKIMVHEAEAAKEWGLTVETIETIG